MQIYTLQNYNPDWIAVEKVSPVYVRLISRKSTIQTLEGPIRANKGDYLCRGINNEQWAISKEDLQRRYKPAGIIEDGWEKYLPDSSNCRIWAAELTVEAEIETPFGRLKGQMGDFVLKEISQDSETPLSYWIVNQHIFRKTYRKL